MIWIQCNQWKWPSCQSSRRRQLCLAFSYKLITWIWFNWSCTVWWQNWWQWMSHRLIANLWHTIMRRPCLLLSWQRQSLGCWRVHYYFISSYGKKFRTGDSRKNYFDPCMEKATIASLQRTIARWKQWGKNCASDLIPSWMYNIATYAQRNCFWFFH